MSEKKAAQTKTIEIFEKLKSNHDASKMLSALTFNLKTKVFGNRNISWHTERPVEIEVEKSGILDSMISYLDEIKLHLVGAEGSLRTAIRELEFKEFREKEK